jgi:hypothetical protein
VDLYFDLNRGHFVTANGTSDQVTALRMKRGDTVHVIVRFCRGIVVVELGSGAAGQLGIKEVGDYDGDFVAAAPSWTKAGTGSGTTYTFELNLNTEELDDLLGVGAPADVASVELNFEMEFTVGDAITSSNTVRLTVDNDVIRGTESGPTDITGGTPVNETAATATINPSGADNSVLYTAVAGQGADGNDITLTYATPAAVATTAVGVVTDAITVTPGTKARMVIAGTLTSDGSTPVVFPVLLYAGLVGGRPAYESGDYGLSWGGTDWLLTDDLGNTWLSSDDVATPDLVGVWAPLSPPVTGNPTVTAGTSSAAQVITAVNASGPAAALVTASASGTVTGAVAAVAATNLTGGVSAAAGVLGSMQVDSGFLYVLCAISGTVRTWKKIALSSL